MLRLGPLLVLMLIACAKQVPVFKPQAYGWSAPRWVACPPEVPGADAAQCALVEVPLDWENPKADKITIFVRKFAPEGEVRGQLWAFDGGPGDTGDGFTKGWFRDITLKSGYELIVPTHRGTAYGTALDCPMSNALEPCVEELRAKWGLGLKHFDSHMAALDLVALAESYQPPEGMPVLAFGGSYGTVWLQRVLQVRPDVFSAAYLDSAGSLSMNFVRFGEWFEQVGREVLSRCAEEPSCAQNFTDSPQAAADRIVGSAATLSGCFGELGIELGDVQRVLSTTLQTNQERALIAPFIAKFDRCNSEDLMALRSAIHYKRSSNSSPTSNGLLNLVTSYRELYRQSESRAELEALSATLLFDNGAMLTHVSKRPLFPRAFARSLDTNASAFTGTLHIVQGALDPLTPHSLAGDIAQMWKSAKTDITILPWGGHASPRYTQRAGKQSCTEVWLTAFLTAPHQPFERQCLAEVEVPDMGLQHTKTRSMAKAFFGVDQAW